MPCLQAKGLDLAYDSFGDPEDAAMLLVSGLGVPGMRWTLPFCAALAARGFRVIRFDNRDAGRSTHFSTTPVPDLAALMQAAARGEAVRAPYTLVDMAADATGLLDALGIGRAHLVGRSMGGVIAQIVAATWPQRALSLTSIMAGISDPAMPAAAPAVMAMLTGRAPDPALDEAGFLDHGTAFARIIASTGFAFDAAAHRAQLLAELRWARGSGGAMRQIAAIAATGDYRPILAGILAPSLVIHGTEDRLVAPACAPAIAALIEGAEVMMVAGMGHDLPPAVHDRVIEAIVRTARRHAAAP